MNLHITGETKAEIFSQVSSWLEAHMIHCESMDIDRPWGGFMVIADQSIPTFLDTFFPEEKSAVLAANLKITPKILIVAPNAQLSWQYHHRRNELWRIVTGPVQVVTSMTDELAAPKEYTSYELITIADGIRHRLIGMDNWGVVAEIWRHTDPLAPSDETDIVRVSDNYGRQ